MQREIGDVLIAWENEAFLSIKELGPEKVEIVVPSNSILAEPPVSIVDKVVDKKGTRKVAQAYLEYLYTPEGQEIAAKNYYRPRLDSVAKKYASTFPKIKLVTIDEVFGGWQKAQKNTFCRWRSVRPDLSAQLNAYGFHFQKTQQPAGLRTGAGLHRVVSQPDCPDSAGRYFSESLGARAGASSGTSLLLRVPWLPIA